jgi:hypothetical protein
MDAMCGQPVWLSSISYRDLFGHLVATGNWSESVREQAEEHLRAILRGVGGTKRERLFRMNVTLCLHRALTDDEVRGLPSCPGGVQGMAGGPIEILRETEPGSDSTKPCHSPHRQLIDPARLDLWVPVDCQSCPPCIARRRIEREEANR